MIKNRNEITERNVTFTKAHTNMMKGIATLLLLFHHLFYKMKYFDTCFVFSDRWIKGLNFIAVNGKVCVALFLFLSGYGLVKSASNSQEGITLKFSVKHIFKILTPLWFIYILFVPLGYAFGRTFTDIYGTGFRAIIYMCMDLTGVPYLFGRYPKANETWWYFGEMIRLYLLFPLFYYNIKKNIVLTFGLSLIIALCFGYVWLLPFVLGMMFAEKSLFTAIFRLHGFRKFTCVLINLLLIVIIAALRLKYGVNVDGFYAVAIICFVLCILRPQNAIGKALTFIGHHSANIFMFHTFIYSKYLRNFIFRFKYPILIFLVLTVVCLIISWAIEKLKGFIRYEKLGKLINTIIDSIHHMITSLFQKLSGFLRIETNE